MAANGKALKQQYTALWNDAQTHFAQCERMAPLIATSRRGIVVQYGPGQRLEQDLYDSTTLMAGELMAMFIAGHVMNPAQQWGSMHMAHPRAKQSNQIQEWLEDCRDRMMAAFSDSLFYAEGPESLIDYCGFGTNCLFSEEAPRASNLKQKGFRGMAYRAEKTGRFLIAEGPDGLVNTVFRKFKLTAQVAETRWGREKLPQKIQASLRTGKPFDSFDIIHAIYPRPMDEQRKGGGNTAMPWASVWLENDTEQVIVESGFRTFPCAVARYQRTPGEIFGRGRGHIAFPDTWTLNSTKRMGLEDFALKIRPPVLMRHDSVIGTLRLTPAGPTAVNTHGRPIQDAIMPYVTGSNPQISMLKEEELRKSIKQIFFVDQILALMEVNKSEMTAFEFGKKIELLFRIMGPVYGRMEREFLRPLWDNCFDTMFWAGAFSPPPPEIFDTDGVIDVTFQNPIARAQRSGDVEAITMAVQDMAPLAQLFPDMLDWWDRDNLTQYIQEIRGVPAKVRRDANEVQVFRQKRMEQQQQEQQMAQMGQAAEAAGKAAPMVKALTEQRAGNA